jgi:hypothetical protein
MTVETKTFTFHEVSAFSLNLNELLAVALLILIMAAGIAFAVWAARRRGGRR